MLKSIIRKAKAVSSSIAQINPIGNRVRHLQQTVEQSQQQLIQLQVSVNSLQSQQELMQKQTLIRSIHTYSDNPTPNFENVTSQLCTFEQTLHPKYIEWCQAFEKSSFLAHIKQPTGKDVYIPHRKVWEFCYILQALQQKGKLRAGSKGLGFGVGREPLPALLASYGCQITATDMDLTEAVEKGWAATDSVIQHSQQLEDLNKDGICDPEKFRNNCTFRFVDMNHIPTDLQDFDFTWSACCLEHLGSIEAGLQYIKNSLKTLKKGGVAVHTTEFNLSSEVETVDNHDTVIFRKQDILRLISELEAEGHLVSPVTFNAGTYVMDEFVDVAPYFKHNFHLKLLLGNYVTTSIGLIIQKQ